MGRYKEDKKKIYKNYFKLTVSQLKSWEVNYHELIFYKPSYDLFIDDKALGYKKNWHKILIKQLNKI